MKRKMIVLGAGMIGATIARDLAGDCDVTVADARPEALARVAGLPLQTVRADLADPDTVRRAVAGFDVAIGALSSKLGLTTLRAVIEAGITYCDISFMADDALQLDDLARARGVTAIVDCGVAPGLSNLMIGWGVAQLAACERIEILVGGLPAERRWPYEYKAPFAPSDVIEEYLRPARMVIDGRAVVREALSEPVLIDVPGVGTLEAFNTDGLRSLLRLPAPNMRERTLRYPGHSELMRVLRATGFFHAQPIDVGGQKVCPREVTSALLFPTWSFAPGEADLTVLRVSVEGTRGGRAARYGWDVLDRYDPATDTRSMSRTTGFTATSMARLLADQRFVRPGVHAPEVPGAEPGILDAVLGDLARRGVACVASGP